MPFMSCRAGPTGTSSCDVRLLQSRGLTWLGCLLALLAGEAEGRATLSGIHSNSKKDLMEEEI